MASTYFPTDLIDQTQSREFKKMDSTFIDPDLLDHQLEEDHDRNPEPDPVIKSAPCMLAQGLLQILLNICKVPHRHHIDDNADDVYQQGSLNLGSNSSDSVFDEPVVSDTPVIPQANKQQAAEQSNIINNSGETENQPLDNSNNHTRSVSVVDLVINQSQSEEQKNEDLKSPLKLPLKESQADNFSFSLVPTPRDPELSFLEKKKVESKSTQGYYEIRRSLYQHRPQNSHYRERVSAWNHLDQGTLSRVFQHVINWKDPANLMSCRQVNKKWKNITDQVIEQNAVTAKQDLKLEDLEYIIENIILGSDDHPYVDQHESIDLDAFKYGSGDMHAYANGNMHAYKNNIESKFEGVGNPNPLKMIDLRGFTVFGEGQLVIDREVILCNGKIQLYGSVVVEAQKVVLKDLEIERQLTEKQISGKSSFSGTLDKQNELEQILFNSVRGEEYWVMHNVRIVQNMFAGLVCVCHESIEVYPLLVLSWCQFQAVRNEIPQSNKCCVLHRCQAHFQDTVFEGKRAIVFRGGKQFDDQKLKLIKVERCNVDRVGRSFDGGQLYNLLAGDVMGYILQPNLRRISSRGHPNVN